MLQLHKLLDFSVKQRLMLSMQPAPFLEHLHAGPLHECEMG